MSTKLDVAWEELAKAIDTVLPSRMKVARVFIAWHKKYGVLLGREADPYELDQFGRWEITHYVRRSDELDVDDRCSIKAFARPLPAKNASQSAARRLRDMLELSFGTKSETSCARCGSGPLFAAVDNSRQFFWDCAACGFAQTSSGASAEAIERPCRYATQDEAAALKLRMG
jgi:ribosomal protein S27AE